MKTLTLAFLLVASIASAQIPIQQTKIWASPDVRNWPATAKITRLDLREDGIHVEFTKQNEWPDIVPHDFKGPILYSLWMFLNVNGEWHGSGPIRFWRGLQASGGDVTRENQVARNWFYDGRWGPMNGHQPVPGEHVGFMVTSGNARLDDGGDVHGVAERSEIVEIIWPASAGASFPPFVWAESAGVVPPPVIVTPPPAPPPPATPPLPSVDWSVVLNQMGVNQKALTDKLADLKTDVAAVKQDVADFRAAVRSKWAAFVNHPAVKYGAAIALGWVAKLKLLP